MANYWESDLQIPSGQPEQQGAQTPAYNADETARAASQQSYAQGYAQSPYAQQRAAYGTPSAPSEPPRKPRGKGRGVALVAICMILSLGCGFLGAFAANRWFPSETANGADGSGGVIVEAPLHTDTSSGETTTSLSSVVSAAKDSVVEITTESAATSSFFGQYVTEGAGSGVVARADGYIVTNNHVVSGASSIKVTLSNGESYTASVVGTDSKTDLAVIKIDANDLTPAVFGNSADVQVGDYVLAIGNPLGSLGGTATEGIVSALNREIVVENQTMTLMQTSAAINPGNSGGGLFNTYGELVGIVNAKPTDSAAGTDSSIDGIGFAIPVDTVKEVVTEIIDNGYVTGRAVMGLSVLEILDAQTARQYGVDRYGVYIVAITDGGGAANAGLQVGDCLVSIDGTAVSGTSDVTSVLDGHSVGDTVEVQIIRDGKMVSAQVTLSESVPTTTQQAG